MQVELRFSESEARPGSPMTFTVAAAPGSLCSVGMMDKSVSLLAGNKLVTPEMVGTNIHAV